VCPATEEPDEVLSRGPAARSRLEDPPLYFKQIPADLTEGTARLTHDENAHHTLQGYYTCRLRHMFARLVIDKGHKVKNASTKVHRGPYTLWCPINEVLTATPQINKTADLLGYLNFFRKAEWAFKTSKDTKLDRMATVPGHGRYDTKFACLNWSTLPTLAAEPKNGGYVRVGPPLYMCIHVYMPSNLQR